MADHDGTGGPNRPGGGGGGGGALFDTDPEQSRGPSPTSGFTVVGSLDTPRYSSGAATPPESVHVGRPDAYNPVPPSIQPPSRNPSKSIWRALGGSPRTPNPSSSNPSSPRDEYDMSLLRNAAPVGRGPRFRSILSEDEDEGDTKSPRDVMNVMNDSEPVVDVTSMVGPLAFQEDPFLKQLQEQEARGHLTGGLGAGFIPNTTIRGEDLLVSSPATATATLTRSMTLSRRLSRRLSRKAPKLSRAATIQSLGQDEANKRGEVIEVIMEGSSEHGSSAAVDLSAMTGPEGLDDGREMLRHSSLPSSKREARVFYPQPNWKPFPMRWPYLLALIVLSLGLAVMEEVLYHRSQDHPLARFTSPSTLSFGAYFAYKFAPTILAVAYGVLWQITDIEVKRLEAFYQLSKEGGALAAESINVDYVTSWVWLRPFWAAKLGHWAVAVSSVASTLAVSLVPTLGVASIVLTSDRAERLENPGVEKQIVFHPVWSRLVTATLVICAAAGCVLLYLLQTRRSGLLADVKGIAGLASMAVVSHILVDFAGLDVASHSEIHAKLKYHRYVLRNTCLAPDDEQEERRQQESNPLKSSPSSSSSSSGHHGRYEHDHLSQNPLPAMLRAKGYIPFALAVAVLLAFIPTTLFTPASVVTDGKPWLLTAFAVCVKLSWGGLDADVRIMEPYYMLSRRHAAPSVLTLDYTAVPFGYLPVRAALNGHLLVFFVGFGSVMAEILTVLLTSIGRVHGSDFAVAAVDPGSSSDPSTGAETPLSFWVSFGLASFVLLYMLAVSTVVFVRRRHPFLPRQPNTIASVLAYIHQSKMIYDFVGTSRLRVSGMAKHLDALGGAYGLGVFEGRDGRRHCGVDREELSGRYVHGFDFTAAAENRPWDQKWDSYD